jgi:putative ABC transport system permease protein
MNFWRDFRFGLRMLANKPGFALVAVLALALGIGPNTALFSVVYSAFFDSTGYPEADRLMTLSYQRNGGDTIWPGIAPGDILEYQHENTVFEPLSAFARRAVVYSGGEGTASIEVGAATPGHISKTAGLRMVLGRDFLPEEAEPGKNGVVILSHRFWKSEFAGDPGVIGRQIRLGGTAPHTIIGVMPVSHAFDGNDYPMWLPLRIDMNVHPQYGLGMSTVWGRLKPGVSRAQAASEMSRIAQNLASAYPATNKSLSLKVEPVRSAWVPAKTKTTIWLLAGAAAFVLLIACANLASLMLARGTARQREIAIRASLGASGGRLFVQLLIESLIVAGAGCVLGGALGWALIRILVTQLPAASLLAGTEPRLSAPVLLFTAAVAVFAGALSGSVPAWHAARENLDGALKMGAGAGSGRRHLRLRRALVVSEFAAAMTLLAGASLCVHSLWSKAGGDLGMDKPENILVFGYGSFDRMANREQAITFGRDVLAAIRTVPGVQRATASTFLPLVSVNVPFKLIGQANEVQSRGTIVDVGSQYFETYGIQVKKGRSIDDRDRDGAEPVAMVNEELARRFLPNQDPLVQYLELEQLGGGRVTVRRRIVGVYHTVKRPAGQAGAIAPEIAVPIEQGSVGFGGAFAVRTSGNPLSLGKPIAQALRQLAPEIQMTNVTTLDKMAADKVARERAYAILFGLLAGLALLLAGVGIYGVMSFVVAQRTKEIGLRMALGAAPGRVIALILKEGMLLAAVGLGLGLLGANFAGRILQTVLNDAPAFDYRAFGAASALLLLSALAACCVPALRASRVAPIDSLRQE